MNAKNSTNAQKMQVRSTTEYSKFKVLDGNRHINPIHLNRLKESMSEDYLFSPIIVNENMEVVDGQHRLKCCTELKLPVYYIVCDGYGLSEIQRYNANTKNWSMDDFLAGYIQLGKKEYEFYKLFKDKYGFAHGECIRMLTGQDHGGTMIKKFQAGNLKIKKYNEACLMAEKIKMIEPYYSGWKRRSFVSAIVNLLRKTEFDIDEFVDKLKYQQAKMYDCSKVEQYIEMIEEIYNFKRRNGEKVNLRFSVAAA